MANDPWYALLLEEPYFSYICSDRFDPDSLTFQDYGRRVISAVNMGYILSHTEPSRQKAVLDTCKGLPEYAIMTRFLQLCDYAPVKFPPMPAEKEYDAMTNEELAVTIMYPFWGRMGGSFEKDFAKSGQLKTGLLLLADRLKQK